MREHRPALRDFPSAFAKAPALYPASLSFSSAVLVIVSISAHWVKVPYGIGMLAFASVFIVLLSMRHEVRTVHTLVNSKYTSLERRIDQLTAALIQNNIEVPTDPEQPKTAKAEDDEHEHW